MYHPGKMYNRPMCGRSAGTYTNLGDLQRDLRGLSPTPPNNKKKDKKPRWEFFCEYTVFLNPKETPFPPPEFSIEKFFIFDVSSLHVIPNPILPCADWSVLCVTE
jgi:hypothetical protein